MSEEFKVYNRPNDQKWNNSNTNENAGGYISAGYYKFYGNQEENKQNKNNQSYSVNQNQNFTYNQQNTNNASMMTRQ